MLELFAIMSLVKQKNIGMSVLDCVGRPPSIFQPITGCENAKPEHINI